VCVGVLFARFHRDHAAAVRVQSGSTAVFSSVRFIANTASPALVRSPLLKAIKAPAIYVDRGSMAVLTNAEFSGNAVVGEDMASPISLAGGSNSGVVYSASPGLLVYESLSARPRVALRVDNAVQAQVDEFFNILDAIKKVSCPFAGSSPSQRSIL
jgi:hypothetical protein